jgi:DNA transformation protein and related proteins
MGRLSNMPNIGSVLEKKLNEVGITNPEALIQLGSKEAFIRIAAIDNSACLNMLYALEGAIGGVRWHGLAEESKEELREFFQRLIK